MMDRNTSRGLAAVRRIKRQHNLDGVYGTLAELFEVGDNYKTAAEVTAGTSLFHYVVDTDETATRVLEMLQREKAGRVTFMPLNRLRPKPINFPNSSDAVALISKLRFDNTYEKALQQVFGKTIVCPNLQVAAQYARSHAVSAITPEGDRADKQGALTGGFYDSRQSRLDSVRNLLRLRTQVEEHQAKLAEVRQSLEKVDQEITRAVGELQKIEQRRQQLEGSYGPMRQELRSKSAELQNKRDALAAKQRSRDNIEATVRELGEQQNAYEAELASPFRPTLTNEEQQRLQILSSSIQDLRRQYSELSSTLSDLEGRKTTLEVELRENLRPRLDQLTSRDTENGNGPSDRSSTSLGERQRELDRLNKAVADVERKLRDSENAIDQARTQLADREQSKTEKQKEQEELARAIERHQKRMEKSMAKKAIITEKAAEVARNIRDLGVLPDEAFEKKYQELQSDRVGHSD